MKEYPKPMARKPDMAMEKQKKKFTAGVYDDEMAFFADEAVLEM